MNATKTAPARKTAAKRTTTRKAVARGAVKPAPVVESVPAPVKEASMEEMIKAIRDHAVKFYEDGSGWDIIVEAVSDEDLAGVIGRARTVDGAFRKILPFLRTIASNRSEIAATAF